MNLFDVGLTVLAAFAVIVGLFNGLARIAITLASLVVAFLLAVRFEERVGTWLISIGVAQTPARFTAYLIIFFATIVAGAVVAWLVGRLLKLVKLSWADRLAGASLGVLAALLGAALVVHPIAAAAPGGAGLLHDSRLAPYVTVVADVANVGVPEDLAGRYRRGVDALRRIWRGETQPAGERPPSPSHD